MNERFLIKSLPLALQPAVTLWPQPQTAAAYNDISTSTRRTNRRQS